LSGNHLVRKGCAVAAVVFFLGIALSPGLTPHVVGVAAQDPYLVTVEVCGVPGHHPWTVSLSKQEYEQLIWLLDSLLERMNHASSQAESLVLLHEAVTRVAALGLLPSGMSASQAYHMVEAPFPYRKNMVEFEPSRNIKSRDNPVLKNSFCAVYAIATKIPGYSPDPLIIPLGLLLVIGSIPALIASLLGQEETADKLAELGVFLWMINPVRWFNFVVFDGYDVRFLSLGLKGLVLDTLSPTGAFWGFSGLMLRPYNEKTYFLGVSLSIYSGN
jgi:hypothetical protein